MGEFMCERVVDETLTSLFSNKFSNNNPVMKSQQKAQRVCQNACNKSSAKYQYSFGREQRFKQRIITNQTTDRFYDLPSQISKRAAIFGKDKRDSEKSKQSKGPTPCQYDPKDVDLSKKILFASGRQECKATSAFYNSTIDYPGPGKYDPVYPKTKHYIYMTGRVKTTYETASPGPIYNFSSTLLDRNKILSKEKSRGCSRFVLPTSKSRISKTDLSESSLSLSQSMNGGVMTRKGNRKIGESGPGAVIPREERFKSVQLKQSFPGPGQYSSFSEFIEGDKK